MADHAELLSRFANAPVARLATVTGDHAPHLVPVVFAAHGETVFTAVDGKPKSTRHLKRLANIAADPRVCLLVDHYDSDWSQLWWVRADGEAAVVDDGPVYARGHALLRAKYPQYQTVSLDGPVIEISVRRWSSWGLP
ncbi:TIGR03668 family PPOX class F420-dependent oxidoreductase [Mycolicibacterium mengxianglii]|uniref:TIGR03668 family PPOX class F420-dependent oxidoreductase n=1 Tax=Mycolicibacterium mengxianglii TaxID=2736649 RepID=UPI0018D12FAE|nr:TIGR03668 family PPOX class F420-dependent oxidoreductase [Mycolicibacterium mengxianglii]